MSDPAPPPGELCPSPVSAPPKKAIHLRLLDFLESKTFLVLVLLGLGAPVTWAIWAAGFCVHTSVIHTAKSPDGHVLTLTFQHRGLYPMGSVTGRISTGDTVISEMLLVDDEMTPLPPEVVISSVDWIRDSDLLGRCVITTTSNAQAQRFVMAYMRIVPGEFDHFPESSYTALSQKTKPPSAPPHP